MATTRGPASQSRLVWRLIPYVLIGYLYCYIMMVQQAFLHSASTPTPPVLLPTSPLQVVPPLQVDPGTHSTGSTSASSSTIQSLKDRVHMLETKLNAYLAYDSDPFYATKVPAKCKNMTMLQEYCHKETKCSLGTMNVCLDDFPYNNCIVYDFGIREEPDFGVILSKPPFSCQVYAFDPSPITQKWFANNQELKDNNNYHLFHYGGGGADETITLREYDWDQVSIYQYPIWVVANPRNCTSGKCRFKKFKPQKTHPLPVRSVDSIMTEFGHDRIDVLKIDVEGSEYRMLEGMIESGACRKVNQMTLEWHHYDFDLRYGLSSIPHLNVFVKLLNEKCGLPQFWLHDPTGWPSNEEMFIDMKLTLRYNLASFMRVVKGQ